MSNKWSSRDHARTSGIHLLLTTLKLRAQEVKNAEELLAFWQEQGGLLSFQNQVQLISMGAGNKKKVDTLVWALREFNKAISHPYPHLGCIKTTIDDCLDAAHQAWAASEVRSKNVQDNSIMKALSLGSLVDGSETYIDFSRDDDDDDEREESEKKYNAL